MTTLDQPINLMIEKVEAIPMPKQELDDFLLQHQIKICNGNYQFLLKYGNSRLKILSYHMVTAILELILMMDYYVKNFKKVNYIFLVSEKNMKSLTMAD